MYCIGNQNVVVWMGVICDFNSSWVQVDIVQDDFKEWFCYVVCVIKDIKDIRVVVMEWVYCVEEMCDYSCIICDCFRCIFICSF